MIFMAQNTSRQGDGRSKRISGVADGWRESLQSVKELAGIRLVANGIASHREQRLPANVGETSGDGDSPTCRQRAVQLRRDPASPLRSAKVVIKDAEIPLALHQRIASGLDMRSGDLGYDDSRVIGNALRIVIQDQNASEWCIGIRHDLPHVISAEGRISE